MNLDPKNIKQVWISFFAVALIVGGLIATISHSPSISWFQQRLGAYPGARDEKMVREGERLYVRFCQPCHDRRFVVRLRELGAGLLPPDYFKIITFGKPRPMPAFAKQLSVEERWRLINYILNGTDRP